MFVTMQTLFLKLMVLPGLPGVGNVVSALPVSFTFRSIQSIFADPSQMGKMALHRVESKILSGLARISFSTLFDLEKDSAFRSSCGQSRRQSRRRNEHMTFHKVQGLIHHLDTDDKDTALVIHHACI
jgi:hypothetical protein